MSHDTSNIDYGEEDEDYYLAPQSQRPFGAGIKRKRVTFVPASSEPSSDTFLPAQSATTSTAAAKYLAIVLGQQTQPQTPTHDPDPNLDGLPLESNPTATTTIHDTTTMPTSTPIICPICEHTLPPNTSLTTHSSSIAHQLAVEHSHPPSHLDRQRKGLKYLEGYGWDPDARLGLGARSEGIRVPVRAVEKRDTAGLGLFHNDNDADKDREGGADDVKTRKRREKERIEREARDVKKTLNAKQVRRLEEEKKRKAEKLRTVFYGEDLSRYLGPDG